MPDESLLEISKLHVAFDTPDGVVEAVKGISLSVSKGECVGLLGERAAGKSQVLRGAFGLLADNGRADGSVRFEDAEILGLPARALSAVRGKRVAFMFESPLTALSPHLTIKTQLCEVLAQHFRVRGAAAAQHAAEWLERVRVPEAQRRLGQYPHELSASLRQRVVLAMAMMCQPALLVADEPTAALDPTVQADLLDVIDELRRDGETAVLLATRGLGVIARMAQRVVVMQAGEIVEGGDVGAVLARPQTELVRNWIKATPRLDGAPTLPTPGDGAPVLAIDDLRVSFPIRVRRGLFGAVKPLRAVDGVSFALQPGETLGVVGESDSGKSTLARAIAQLLPRNAGAVTFLGHALLPSERDSLRRARRDLQIVFDEGSSLDPRRTLGASIAEPLCVLEPGLTRAERDDRVRAMMLQVDLEPGLSQLYPHELSPGQAQRAAIARAAILKPRLVVCDDVAASLDAADRARVLQLLTDLQRAHGMAILFLSRDLAAARAVSHKMLVLYRGRPVEYGACDMLLRDPRHPYTRALLAAELSPDPDAPRRWASMRLADETLGPLDTRASLRFLKSRLINDPDAVQYRPRWLEAASSHFVAEHD